MTNLEYKNIIYAIGTVEENEKFLCEEFCKLNPARRKERERERDLILYGLIRARFEIEKRIKTTNADHLDILKSYAKMIERSGAEYPTVVLDDIAKSINHVLKEAQR